MITKLLSALKQLKIFLFYKCSYFLANVVMNHQPILIIAYLIVLIMIYYSQIQLIPIIAFILSNISIPLYPSIITSFCLLLLPLSKLI